MVEMVRRLNNNTKAETYRSAGESLMQKMYGKQCEYLAQMKSLHAEAAEREKALQEQREAEAGEQQGSRQQRKIIAAFLTAENSHVGMKALYDHDVSLPEGAREEVLDRINDGRINQLLERDLLRSISSPMDLDGSLAVKSSLNSKHEYRIAAWLSGAGFENYQSLVPDNLDDLYRAYPTPLDFEHALPKLVEHIRKFNGDQKAAEYQAAGESLMQKMYGKQCEYWEQVKVLNKEAEDKKKREMGSGATERLARSETIPQQAEMERSSEWVPGVAAFCQTSRYQALQGVVKRELIDRGLKAGDSCEDSVLCRPDAGLFGVFDGAGGEGHGEEASRFAAQMIERYHNAYGTESLNELIGSVESTMISMEEHRTRGMTTAVLGKVITKGDRKYLAYVNIGDSRLYVVHANGEADLITTDEGFGNVITNAMSADGGSVKQYGTIPVDSGDRIVLCSDGITGDRDPDLMSNEELARIVMGSKNADDAAKNLVTGARKRDDRTALVFSI
jgi:protein phosphatase